MNRDHAWGLLNQWVTKPGLVRHMRSVEIAMRAYALAQGEDPLLWGLTGLLHDFDYERYPATPSHPLEGSKVLREAGYPEELIYAICSHADDLAAEYPRIHRLDLALYACDEMSGFITAACLVRPEGIHGMTAGSVRKKMKNKLFARNVPREDLERGAREFGVELNPHIDFLIAAFTPHAAELAIERGLTGETQA